MGEAVIKHMQGDYSKTRTTTKSHDSGSKTDKLSPYLHPGHVPSTKCQTLKLSIHKALASSFQDLCLVSWPF